METRKAQNKEEICFKALGDTEITDNKKGLL